jgi:hypothetical protein
MLYYFRLMQLVGPLQTFRFNCTFKTDINRLSVFDLIERVLFSFIHSILPWFSGVEQIQFRGFDCCRFE